MCLYCRSYCRHTLFFLFFYDVLLFVLPHVRSRFIVVMSTFCFVHKAFHILTLHCLLGKVISPGRHKIVSLQGFSMEKGQFHGFNNCFYVPII